MSAHARVAGILASSSAVTIFGGNAILPGQFFGGVSQSGSSAIRDRAEMRLMLAVLTDAIATYQRYASAAPSNRRGQRLFREAQAWIESQNITWPYSFANICSACDLDADNLRSGLQEWRKQKLQGKELPKYLSVRRIAGTSKHSIREARRKSRQAKP